MQQQFTMLALVAILLLGSTSAAKLQVPGAKASNPISLQLASTLRLGAPGQTAGGAEQVDYDDKNKVAYVIGGKTITTVDLSDLANPRIIAPDFVSANDIQDVVFCGGYVAVAVSGTLKTDNGSVQIFSAYDRRSNTPLQLVTSFPVGALPDQLTFSKKCDLLVVSNEGEPNNEDDSDAVPYSIDPEGSVSIINLYYSKKSGVNEDNARKSDDSDKGVRPPSCNAAVCGVVRTADFQAFNDRREELLQKGEPCNVTTDPCYQLCSACRAGAMYLSVLFRL